MHIYSPMATGNGAYVVHQMLEAGIPGYKVCPFNPWWTVVPPALSLLCRATHQDIIHTTPDHAIFNARKDVPLIITFHNYVLDAYMAGHSSPVQRLHYATDLKWFTKKACQRADAITAVSRFTAALVNTELKPKKNIRVIYNGIDEQVFSPGKTGQRPGKTIKILFSGNLSRRKGADLLPGILKQLNPGIELMYTTGLRCKQRLPEHPALTCVGQVPYSEMPELYRQADILLFPTVREGFGLAAAEAMACGLPVVATDCSSIPELVVDDKGGFLCRVGDTRQFAARINELAESASLRQQMGEYNRARVEEKFTLQRMLNEYRALFEETSRSFS
jgi:glycosyltransferase involved in cell wall biosynthesis